MLGKNLSLQRCSSLKGLPSRRKQRENDREHVAEKLQRRLPKFNQFSQTGVFGRDRTAQQLREAFPFARLPRFLLRDRDTIFGNDFQEHVRDMGICEVLSAPRAPWQRAYVERVIGSVRRECLDHVIVFHESSLRRLYRLQLLVGTLPRTGAQRRICFTRLKQSCR
jgi:hypothetical protein